jgi:hypothetical protein
MTEILKCVIAAIGLDIGKNSFHVVGLAGRGAIALRQKWSRGQVETRLANMPACLIGIEASKGAHYWARVLSGLGHEVRLISPQFMGFSPSTELSSRAISPSYVRTLLISSGTVEMASATWSGLSLASCNRS